ncbi:MAG: hypothetical protein HY800_09055 [Ignavibacteriales bacterium]|nr:hypothetical protein [Ignavibacteriales bacterium]
MNLSKSVGSVVELPPSFLRRLSWEEVNSRPARHLPDSQAGLAGGTVSQLSGWEDVPHPTCEVELRNRWSR